MVTCPCTFWHGRPRRGRSLPTRPSRLDQTITYVLVATKNRYTDESGLVVLAEDLMGKHFGGKKAPEHEVIARISGAELCGARYEQLLDWAEPMEGVSEAFRIIPGDFVTTEDGTGIVHTAPTFGADDARVAAAAGVPPMLIDDGTGQGVPLVDLQGRIRDGVGPLAGRYVKEEYYDEGEAPERSVDVEIAIDLKGKGLAFLVEKYEHNYPHCWRTDKPVLYYPLDSWFIRATAAKERMQELNNTIRWKPASTGSGPFRQVVGKPERLEPQPLAVLGHSHSHLVHRRRHRTPVHRLCRGVESSLC